MQILEVSSAVLIFLFFLSVVFDFLAKKHNEIKFHLISAVCSFSFILIGLYFFNLDFSIIHVLCFLIFINMCSSIYLYIVKSK